MDRAGLDALDAFAAVARHGSFRRAAVERGVSASTLSQTLRDLEARLGLRLMNRTTRSVALTEAGAALLARVEPALGEIGAAVADARSAQASPSGTLRINAPAPAVDLCLAPLAGDFLAAYPDVRLEVIEETAFVDIVAKGFDAGVRWGESLAQDVVAVALGPPQCFQVVASPAAITRWGAPRHPRDLLDRPCLRGRFPSGAEPAWEFEKDGERLRLSPSGPVVTTSREFLLRAALAGTGFIRAFDGDVAAHLESGALVSVLDDWCERFAGPFLYYPSRRQPPSALRAFVEFIQARRKRDGW